MVEKKSDVCVNEEDGEVKTWQQQTLLQHQDFLDFSGFDVSATNILTSHLLLTLSSPPPASQNSILMQGHALWIITSRNESNEIIPFRLETHSNCILVIDLRLSSTHRSKSFQVLPLVLEN